MLKKIVDYFRSLFCNSVFFVENIIIGKMSAIMKISGTGEKWYRNLARCGIPSDSLNIIEFNFW